MGQSSSRYKFRSAKPTVISPWTSDSDEPDDIISNTDDTISGNDYTLNLPDKCLFAFSSRYSPVTRNGQPFVCRWWLIIELKQRQLSVIISEGVSVFPEFAVALF
ncbi:F-box protein-like [Forsythia ovata]|uniref:F-box protein-like n=1 Tax=Forsythia ovata TaxID=205694 RepID=A0ABD1VJE8_9LAMI